MENLLTAGPKVQESWTETLRDKLDPEKSGTRYSHYCHSCVRAQVIDTLLDLLLSGPKITENTRFYSLCAIEFLLQYQPSGSEVLNSPQFPRMLMKELQSDWILFRERALQVYNHATHNYPRKLTIYLFHPQFVSVIIRNSFSDVEQNRANWESGEFQKALHFHGRRCTCKNIRKYMEVFTKNMHKQAREALAICFIANARYPKVLLFLVQSIPSEEFNEILFGRLSDTLMSSQILLLLLRPSLVDCTSDNIREQIKQVLLYNTEAFSTFLRMRMEELCDIADTLTRTCTRHDLINSAHYFLNLVEFLSRDPELLHLFRFESYKNIIKQYYNVWVRLRHGKKQYGCSEFSECFVNHEMSYRPETGVVRKEYSCWSVVCLELLQSRICGCTGEEIENQHICRMKNLFHCCLHHARHSSGEECCVHSTSAILLANELREYCGELNENVLECECVEAMYLRLLGYSKWDDLSAKRRKKVIQYNANEITSSFMIPPEIKEQVEVVFDKCAKKCEFCGQTEKLGTQMPRCSHCKKVYYCNKECQAKHWDVHKPICTHQVCTCSS